MNIIGNKVILRALEERDNEMLWNLINDPEVEKMIGGYSYPVSLQHQMDWFNSLSEDERLLRCIIVDKKDMDDSIGTIILSNIDLKNGTAEIHIKLIEPARGKGYGSDAVATMVSYGFNELRLNCIYSNILEHNISSQKVFIKCGFQKEGIYRSRIFKNGHYINICSYSLLRNDEYPGRV